MMFTLDTTRNIFYEFWVTKLLSDGSVTSLWLFDVGHLIFIVLCDSKNEQKIKAFLTEELFIFEEEKIDYTIEFSSHFKRTGEGKIPLFMRQNG